MARAQLTNNAQTTLSAAISSTGATTFTVASGGGALFPSSGYFYVTVLDAANIPEIMKCTTRATDLFTVTRAQEGTAARTFTSGAYVNLNLTAAVINELLPTDFTGVTGTLPIANGGTAATTAAAARTSLGSTTVGDAVFIATSAAAARSAMTAAASGANADITSLAAPALGAATATTQAVDTNNTTVATTAMVLAQAASATPPAVAAAGVVGTSTRYARGDHTHAVDGLGYNQTWTDVTGSRALSTTYTNSTGRPIFVRVVTSLALNPSITPLISGTGMGTTQSNDPSSGSQIETSWIVPNGVTYSCVMAGCSIANWWELR